MTDTKIVFDCETGEQTKEPLTAADSKQRKKDAAEAAKRKTEDEAEAKRLDDLRESAHAKLKAVGLTDDEIAAL
jgi:hypothetical protein